MVALLLSVGLTLVLAPTPAHATNANEQDYVNRINALRTSLGLNPLILDPNLEAVAESHTSWMIANNSFTHSTDLAAGVTTPWLKLGENIGKGSSNDAIWPLFLASPGHYANITDPAFTHVGVGVFTDASGVQWTTHRFMQAKTPPPDPDVPFGSVDSLSWTGPGTLTVSGWAIDPNTASSIQVAVYVDGVGISWYPAAGSRPDVGTAYPNYGANHGYSVALQLAGGSHTVCVYGINVVAGASNPKLGCRTATLSTGNPFGAVDAAWSAGPGNLHVAGWAIDPDTTASTQIAVYVDGVGVSWFPAAGARGDLAAAYPFGPAHGFDASFAATGGTHTVCVYAINTLAGNANPLLGCRSASVATGVPFGAFDTASSSGPGTLHLTGWALDPDTAASIQVAVYVDGVGVSWFGAAANRPDIGAGFPGYGSAHGFDIAFNATGGSHTVCVYGINVGPGAGNPLLGCRTATVPTGNPYGAFDTLTRPTSTSLRVTGWALDPDTAASIPVAIYIDGKGVGWFTASASRPDIANAFPGYGPAHGADVTFSAAAGSHTVCLYAINSGPGTVNPLLNCRSI